MPKESDWILYPSYSDKTFIRDALGYELWREMGHYAPRTRYVELFVHRQDDRLNREKVKSLKGERFAIPPSPYPLPQGEGMSAAPLAVLPPGKWTYQEGMKLSRTISELSTLNHELSVFTAYDYEGVYVLVEKIKRGKERVNVRKLHPQDNAEPEITGGYIFKKDRLKPDEHGFKTGEGVQFCFVEPKERDITLEQQRWLTNYMNEFERVLFSDNFRDPTNAYARYIDVDSFIDYHWMVEMGKCVDGYWFSQYFHKERGGKLAMGPIWDWDISFGNSFYVDGWRTNGWLWEAINKPGVLIGPHYKWFARLFEDPDFLQRYIDRWAELRQSVFATSNVLAQVDRLADEVRPVQSRNYQRWNNLRTRIHPNHYVGTNYQDEVNWLKDWIVGRLGWIDNQDFPPPAMVVARAGASPLPHPTLSPPSGSGEGGAGLSVRMACLVGKIYYTTNGTDPRLYGGAVSPAALEYCGPILLGPTNRLFARVRSEYNLWSAPRKVGASE